MHGHFRADNDLFLSLGFDEKSIFIELCIFFQLYSPISFVTDVLTLKLSRIHEFQADKFAVDQKHGKNLLTGLGKLFKENSGDMDPDDIYASFNYSHPTFIERMNYIKSLIDKEE